MKFSLILMTLGILATSCRSVAKPPASEVATSERVPSIPDAELKGLTYEFCPTKKSFSLVNALWLTYFASAQYSHFKIVGPQLEAYGFGDPGEGAEYLRNWYILRIKRISENKFDTDDTWKDEDERMARLASVTKEFETNYKTTYADDGLSAIDFEKSIVASSSIGKIQFHSGVYESGPKVFIKGSTQVFYAEHSKDQYSILSIRGSEFDESDDLVTDAKIAMTKVPGMGSIHVGFYKAYMEIEAKTLAMLEERSKVGTVNLWVTGHSLGASISTLLVAKIMMMHDKGELKNVNLLGTYTIGSPRVGDVTFSKQFETLAKKQAVTVVRIRNHGDAVTSIPLTSPLGFDYWHVGALAYVNADGKLHFEDGWDDIEKNTDYMKLRLPSVADHRTVPYFQAIKKAYLAHAKEEVGTCALKTPNVPPTSFFENPEDRPGGKSLLDKDPTQNPPNFDD